MSSEQEVALQKSSPCETAFSLASMSAQPGQEQQSRPVSAVAATSSRLESEEQNNNNTSEQSNNSPQILHPSSDPLCAATAPIPLPSSFNSPETHQANEEDDGDYPYPPPSTTTSSFSIPLHPSGQHYTSQYQQQQQQIALGAQSAPLLPALHQSQYDSQSLRAAGHQDIYYYSQQQSQSDNQNHHPLLSASLSPVEYEQKVYPPYQQHSSSQHHQMMPMSAPSAYYSPHYQQSLKSPTFGPSIREDRHQQYQFGPTPSLHQSRRSSSSNFYHPYLAPKQQHYQQQLLLQQQQQQARSSPLQTSFSSPSPTTQSTIKASSIFTPVANMMPDVRFNNPEYSGSNYGRLPDGKIIELFPAMMRTIQACEYCRSRKAKCSGGLPCDRCSKKNVKCEYAQLDKKRKIKTTTSEHDMSGGSNGGVGNSGNRGTTTSKTCKGESPEGSSQNEKTRLAKKLNRSMKSSIMTSDYEQVPLDLESSPFTPISLFYQRDSEEAGGDQNTIQDGSITLPEFSTGIPSHPSIELKRLGQDEWSPSSTTSQNSSNTYSNVPAPEAIQSPRPFFWTPRSTTFRQNWDDFESSSPSSSAAAPSGTQESAFRRSHLSSQTSFF